MRVAHVIDELAPAGGIEEALVTLIQALFAHDVQSVVLSFHAPATANPYARRLQAAQTALLVPPGDSERLAAAQLRLAGDPHLRARLGWAARQAYEQGPFTAGQVGSAVAQIYWAALGGSAGQPSSVANIH